MQHVQAVLGNKEAAVGGGGGRRQGRHLLNKHRAPALQSKGEHQGRTRPCGGNLVTVGNQPGSGTHLAGTQKTLSWGHGRG